MPTQISRKRKNGTQKMLVGVEASRPWVEWSDRLSDHVGMTRAMMIDMAVRAFAVAEGFKEKPPRR